MRPGITAVAVIALLAGGEWVYRSFLRPIDPLRPEVLALAQHFRAGGLDVRPYPVRHGFRHSYVSAAAAFEIPGFPLVVAIDVCPTTDAAEARLRSVALSPNLTHPARNGRIVMYLPMWGNDTGVMAQRIQESFSSFPTET